MPFNLHDLLSSVGQAYGLPMGLFGKKDPSDPINDPNGYLMDHNANPGTVAPPPMSGVAPAQPTPNVGAGVTSAPASTAPTPPAPAAPNEDDITVTGKRPTAMEGRGHMARGDAPIDPPPVDLSNLQYIRSAQAAADADRTATNPDGSSVHHGMFGVHGTMRDLLGLFGDTYSQTNGRAAIYAPQQQREKEGDAMAGYTEQPQQAMERLAAGGFPDVAQKIGDSVDNKDIKDATLANTQAYRDAMQGDKRGRLIQSFANSAGQTLNGAKTPEDQAASLKVIMARMKGLKIDPAEMGITPDMSPQEIAAVVRGSITTNQQQLLPIAQQNANAHTTIANKQPAPRIPPNATDASLAAPILDFIGRGGKPTPQQLEILQRTNHGLNRGGGKGRAAPAMTPELKAQLDAMSNQ